MTEIEVRAHVTERLDVLAAVVGGEVAVIEKRLRADFKVENDALRAEIETLRSELQAERDVHRAEVIELPDWRSARAAH